MEGEAAAAYALNVYLPASFAARGLRAASRRVRGKSAPALEELETSRDLGLVHIRGTSLVSWRASTTTTLANTRIRFALQRLPMICGAPFIAGRILLC